MLNKVNLRPNIYQLFKLTYNTTAAGNFESFSF